MKNFITLLALLFFMGCETVVDVDVPKNPPKLVLNSTLNENDFIGVNLSESRYILDDTDFRFITGAKVDIYEDGAFLETLPDSTNGNYISATHKPERGKSYKVIASKPGFDEVSAEVTLPIDTVKVLEITVDTIQISNYDYIQNYTRFNVKIQDDGTKKNFYTVSLITEYYYYEYDYSFSPPVLLDSTYTKYLDYIESRDPIFEDFSSYDRQLLFNDELFNGNIYTVPILSSYYDYEADYPERGSVTFTLIIGNTSESYYQYNITSSLQDWTNNDPFAQPVQVYTNITNGYGILGAYNSHMYPVDP